VIDKESLDRWFNISLLMLLLIVVFNSLCRHPYHTNPDLRLLVGDTLTFDDSIHCSNPVVSPKDKKVYYLGGPSDSHGQVNAGSIYTINFDGTDNKKFLEGKFYNLAVSRDGEKLAVLNYRSYEPLEPDSLILVITISTLQIDSFWISFRGVGKIEWNKDGNYLYYPAHSMIHRLHLPTRSEEVVDSIPRLVGYDLFSNDLIYLDSMVFGVQISPNDKYAIGIGSDCRVFLMRNIETQKLDTLSGLAEPYAQGKVQYPYWHPEDNTIVFMAQPYWGSMQQSSGEIWILKNVFDYIKKK
jgi:WD40 repeat protein